jgi:hypothetical protein
MDKWKEVKSDEELRDIPNGTRIRYNHGNVTYGYEFDSYNSRYLIHTESGGFEAWTGVWSKERNRYNKGTSGFRVSRYDKVEYHITDILEGLDGVAGCKRSTAIDSRTEDEKVIAEMLLG